MSEYWLVFKRKDGVMTGRDRRGLPGCCWCSESWVIVQVIQMGVCFVIMHKVISYSVCIFYVNEVILETNIQIRVFGCYIGKLFFKWNLILVTLYMITVFKRQAVNCVAKFYSTIFIEEIYPEKRMRKLEGGASKDIFWKEYK